MKLDDTTQEHYKIKAKQRKQLTLLSKLSSPTTFYSIFHHNIDLWEVAKPQ